MKSFMKGKKEKYISLFSKKLNTYLYFLRELVDTPDGGIFSLDWTPTKEGLENDKTPTLVVLHGLTGGSDESYIRCLLELVREHKFLFIF